MERTLCSEFHIWPDYECRMTFHFQACAICTKNHLFPEQKENIFQTNKFHSSNEKPKLHKTKSALCFSKKIHKNTQQIISLVQSTLLSTEIEKKLLGRYFAWKIEENSKLCRNRTFVCLEINKEEEKKKMASLIAEPLLLQGLSSKSEKANLYDEDNDCIFISTNVIKTGLCYYFLKKKRKKVEVFLLSQRIVCTFSRSNFNRLWFGR